MAEQLYALAGEYAGAERLRARLRPLLRDRHDRPDARAARGRAVGAGADRAGDRRRDLERAAERDRQRALLRRRRARRAERAGGESRPPDVVVVDPPRAGLSTKVVRRIIDSSPKRDRLRLLQPDDARAERGAARRSRLRPAQSHAGRHVPADAAHRVRGAAGARRSRAPRYGQRATAASPAPTCDRAGRACPPRDALGGARRLPDPDPRARDPVGAAESHGRPVGMDVQTAT